MIPDWLRDVISLAAISLGIPGIILWLLNRKGANKKLDLEETSVDADVFAKQTAALELVFNEQRQALESSQKATVAAQEATLAAQAATAAALAEVTEYRDERQELLDTVRDHGLKLNQVRTLFQKVVAKTSYTMTAEEQEEFDSTKPTEYVRRRRAAAR